MRDTFLIVDGNSLMHRAFHALPLMDYNGVYTNAVHGFLSMLLRCIRERAPRYCAVAFDEHAPPFRHTEYEEYKAGRAPTPDELRPQFDIIKEILSSMGLGVLSLTGYEADDILGTLSSQCAQRDIAALLLTGDRDALQLVSDDTTLLLTRKGISDIEECTPARVQELFGVRPDQITDLKGLMGDSSDNIPGIPGVGEKTAVKLLTSYDTLENVLAHADEIKGKLKEKLESMKRSHALMKAANAAIRKGKTPDRQIPALLELGLTQSQAEELLKPDFCGRIGFASFSLQNSNANIRRVEQRIRELERAAERNVTREQEGNGYTYREDVEENRVMFIFPDKPEADVRSLLKRHGFKWSPSRNAWVRMLNNAGRYAAERVREQLDR